VIPLTRIVAAGLLVSCVALPPVLARPALADPSKEPLADFSADLMTRAGDGNWDTQRFYHSKGLYRREVHSNYIVILNSWTLDMIGLIPSDRRYRQQGLTGDTAHPNNPFLLRSPKIEKIGDEMVDGVRVTKYAVTGKYEEGTRYEGTAWTTAENIVVKMEYRIHVSANPLTYHIVLKNLRIGPVDPKLFEVPAGYKAD
jgi:hypothetical protein